MDKSKKTPSGEVNRNVLNSSSRFSFIKKIINFFTFDGSDDVNDVENKNASRITLLNVNTIDDVSQIQICLDKGNAIVLKINLIDDSIKENILAYLNEEIPKINAHISCLSDDVFLISPVGTFVKDNQLNQIDSITYFDSELSANNTESPQNKIDINPYPSNNNRCLIKFMLILLLTASIIFLVQKTFSVVMDVKLIRSMPNRYFRTDKYKGNSPLQVLGRALLFLPGTDSYESKVRYWAYNAGLDNNIWNRLIMQKDVTKMSLEELTEFIPIYPFDNTNLIPYLNKILNMKKYQVLPLYNKYSNSSKYYMPIIENRLLDNTNKDEFVSASLYLAQMKDIPFNKILSKYWEKMNQTEKSIVVISISQYLIPGSISSDNVEEWLLRKLKDDSIKINEADLLIGCILNTNNSDNRQEIISLIAKNKHQINEYSARKMAVHLRRNLIVNILGKLIDKLGNDNVEISLVFFETMLQNDITGAERYVKKYLDGRDSELKKGMIVHLVNYDSYLGNIYIDKAFSGKESRTVYFEHTINYIYTSDACNQYQDIARHDYLETGKTWPPSYVKKPTYKDEARRWQEFIEKYPWFPGTDDAYYRLAFKQYEDGDMINSFNTINKYIETTFADDDIAPFMGYLLKNIILDNNNIASQYYEINTIKPLITGDIAHLVINMDDNDSDNMNVEKAIYAIKWLNNNLRYADILNLNKEERDILLGILETLRDKNNIEALNRMNSEIKENEQLLLTLNGVTFLPKMPMNTDGKYSVFEDVSSVLAREINDLQNNIKKIADYEKTDDVYLRELNDYMKSLIEMRARIEDIVEQVY